MPPLNYYQYVFKNKQNHPPFFICDDYNVMPNEKMHQQINSV